MPTYVYKFIDTGETLEVQQAFTDDALTEAVHPTSGETLAVKKVFLPVGVTFKGGGFYKTDSRNGSSSSSNSSNGSSGESSSTSSSGDSASGSASKTESSSSSTSDSAKPAPAPSSPAPATTSSSSSS